LKMEIVAHRCLYKTFPENSLEGFIQCMNLNCLNGIEIDIAKSKSKQLVVIHPNFINSYTGRTFENAVPLEEYLKINLTKTIYIDVKGYGKYGISKLRKIQTLLSKYNIPTSKIKILSRDTKVLVASQKLMPDIETVLISNTNLRKKINDQNCVLIDIPLKNKFGTNTIVGSFFPKGFLRI